MIGGKCGCGGALDAEAKNCSTCRWPYHPDGWAVWTKAGPLVWRITLDTSCVNARREHSDLNQLEAWHHEGHIRIQRAPAFMEELRGLRRVSKGWTIEPQPHVFRLDSSVLDGGDVFAGELFPIDRLRALLLPTTMMKALTVKQQRDLEHLQQHVHTGGVLFVTLDVDDFIKKGRREKLYRNGIWAFTPGEAVEHLRAWHPALQ